MRKWKEKSGMGNTEITISTNKHEVRRTWTRLRFISKNDETRCMNKRKWELHAREYAEGKYIPAYRYIPSGECTVLG